MIHLPAKRGKTILLPGIMKVLGEGNIETIVMRDPTLEEAYLSIIK